MLRRGEGEFPEKLPHLRLHVAIESALLENRRHTEVEDLRHALLVLERDEDVVRREVPVKDVLASEVGETHQGLDHQRQELGEGPPPERGGGGGVQLAHNEREKTGAWVL